MFRLDVFATVKVFTNPNRTCYSIVCFYFAEVFLPYNTDIFKLPLFIDHLIFYNMVPQLYTLSKSFSMPHQIGHKFALP